MSLKTWILIGAFIGGTIGGYVPELFGAGLFSMWGIVGNGIGGLVGIWAAYKFATGYLSL